MRIIKLGLISIVVLSIVITAMSLLLPSSVNISKAIDIRTPKDSVYNYVSNLENWSKWYAYYNAAEVNLSSITSGKGASIKIGKTKISITEAADQSIKAIWETNNSRIPGEFNFITSADSSVCTVQWKFDYKVKWYPWEKFASIVSVKAIGSSMEKSLDNLKLLVEKR